MGSGFYAAYTGLAARMSELDVVANNLANVSTTGYRGQNEFYNAVTASQEPQAMSPLNVAINDYGVLGGTSIDFAQGNLQQTGNNLDLAIKGPGFFAVRTAGGVRYTRDGAFHVSAAGEIVNEQGDAVLNPKNLPIQVPLGTVTIAQDGTVSVDGAIAGQVQVSEFASDAQLEPEGDTNFIAPSGAAQPAKNSTVASGMLESSNLNAIQETVSLLVLQRHADMMEKALSIFLDDFNRTAVQELAVD
ncbi:MAG: flagellar basal-body rod protein FlgF [Candidatus Acidiferrales bacterium]